MAIQEYAQDEKHGKGIALICDLQGTIRQVLYDTLGVHDRAFAGQSLTQLIDRGSLEKLLNFLASLRKNGATFDWEMNIPIHGSIVTLHFIGLLRPDQMIVMGAETCDNVLRLSEDMLLMNNEEIDALRAAIKEKNEIIKDSDLRDTDLYEEISRLNNELVSLHREVSRKNAEMEGLNLNLKKAQQLAHLGNWDWNIRSGSIEWSDECYRVFGYRPGEVKPVTYDFFISHVHPEDVERMNDSVMASIKNKKPFGLDFRIIRRDGTIVYAHNEGEVRYDKTGEPVKMFGTVQDITVRKRAEEALRESEEKFRDIVETAIEGIWLLDRENRIVFVNSRISSMLGYLPKDIMGRYAYEFVDARYVKIAKTLFDNRKGGLKGNIDIKFRKKDGSEMWARISSSPRFKDGVFDGVLEMLTDITSDKQVTFKMGWLASFPKFSPDPVIEMDRYGQISYSNPAADELFPDLRDAGRDHPYLAGIETIFATLHRSRLVVPPREVWIGSSCYEQVFSYHAESDSIRIYGRVITRRKQLEEALYDEKSRAELYLDLMSHDINNLNHVALGYLELIDGIVEDKKLKDLVVKPIEAINNSSNLIENVRKLQKAETGELKTEAIDLNDVLSGLQAQYSQVQGKDVTIYFEQRPDSFVLADGLIKDVFSNLIGNAIKHSIVDSVHVNLGLKRHSEGVKDYFLISVEDDGPGIPDAQKGKIFDRFHRGKTKASGKGLGLYLVKTLVEGYHGKVWVEDRAPGDYTKGARFVIMLPALY